MNKERAKAVQAVQNAAGIAKSVVGFRRLGAAQHPFLVGQTRVR